MDFINNNNDNIGEMLNVSSTATITQIDFDWSAIVAIKFSIRYSIFVLFFHLNACLSKSNSILFNYSIHIESKSSNRKFEKRSAVFRGNRRKVQKSVICDREPFMSFVFVCFSSLFFFRFFCSLYQLLENCGIEMYNVHRCLYFGPLNYLLTISLKTGSIFWTPFTIFHISHTFYSSKQKQQKKKKKRFLLSSFLL